MTVNAISPTIQEFNGERFYLCGEYFQHNGKRLHRAVWQFFHGEIPAGYHVHHIDHNKANNNPDNLTLLEGSEHLSEHMHTEDRMEYAKEHIKEMQEQAKEWHHSEGGKAWHSEHAKAVWQTIQPTERKCTNCGCIFLSRRAYAEGANHFCSGACRAAFRKKSGVDNVTRVCAECGSLFVTDKYSKAKCCSHECAVKLRWGK